MSVAELIEQIKALPPDELEVVRSFVLNGSEDSDEQQTIRYATDEQFDRAMDQVFTKHEELMRRLAE
jgi:hypothetical protein